MKVAYGYVIQVSDTMIMLCKTEAGIQK